MGGPKFQCVRLGFPIAIGSVEAKQGANEGEYHGANRTAAKGNRVHSVIGVDPVVKVNPVQEEDAGSEQESKGDAEKQSAELAFEDSGGDAQDEGDKFEGESCNQAWNSAQIAIFVPEHSGENAGPVVS